MRVIAEERLLEIKDEWHDKYGLRESMAIDHLINTEMQEIDINETLEDKVLRLEMELKDIKKSLKELTSGFHTII